MPDFILSGLPVDQLPRCAAKIAELAKQLFDAMVTEERKKVKQRLAQMDTSRRAA